MSGERKARVYADVREEASGLPSLLEQLGVLVVRKQLSEGDYVIPEDTVIERKSASDFISSLLTAGFSTRRQGLQGTTKRFTTDGRRPL
ncbi:MAG: hypothetical protein OSP8Acid_05480 [uncultured Acidilobus sp. OSP8]|jgi:ERCC4-type nuclease|nr:MAG: hypothetical protein OSP8Acid_05480 [uncultured Acidilobus sp. OSP8]